MLTFALRNDSYLLKDLWVGVDFILEFFTYKKIYKNCYPVLCVT
jgi:hypothetical protein